MGIMRNIIFDMDGTLLNSMEMWDNLGTMYLAEKNVVPPSDIKQIIENKTLEESAEYFITELGVKGTVESVVNEFISLINDQYRYTLKLKKGMKEYVLNQYENGSKMCILTTSDKELAAAAMERNGIGHCFTEIFTAETLGMSKRTGDIFIKTCELMGFEPESTWAYEDALYAAKSAKEAGCKLVAVYDKANESDWAELKGMAEEVIE